MNRTWIPMVAITFAVVALVACGSPRYESPPADEAPAAPAAAETGPDPTVVDPSHYTAEFENDRVRLVRIRYGPGEESIMHYHPDIVGVFLTDQHVLMTMPDGSSEEIHAKVGEHLSLPAGQHLPKNIGDEPFELVLVELKSGGAPAAGEAGPDPTVVDADHYTVEFENEQVRVVRIRYGPGEESVMHYHPDHVAVFLTEHRVLMTLPDGSTAELEGEAGGARFAAAEQHLPKNIGEGLLEVLLVGLK